MLLGVCDENRRTIDPRFFQRTIEQSAGWPDKRTPFAIFFIAWLFADKHDGSPLLTFTGHYLRRIPIEVARFAALKVATELRKRFGLWTARRRVAQGDPQAALRRRADLVFVALAALAEDFRLFCRASIKSITGALRGLADTVTFSPFCFCSIRCSTFSR